MKHKTFSLLEKIEKKKIEKETIKIKNIYLHKKKHIKQLKLLSGYQQEYLRKIHDKLILGVSVHQWQNYNSFISVLEVIIQDNINTIKKDEKIIQESFKIWSKNQIQGNIWKHLNMIHKRKILRIKKIKDAIINDSHIQLKFFKKV
ncbi:flagellar export protein FliJ [Buchnera aphidicola]|uniref:Flagellar FliJ protein n=2 Tax=Buchnera aphidicola TaxID=9 RepID=FLIJ_BUCAI|nr:flagellar export protein FliJ [Buchnera aphidicola]P57179.1 RecName: Full=Flagellar FliJ protein [Buchnera aphidicola str. APS (Acyrthosiphon pisum)]pir/E84938/ flagellar fliJ protein [imported] - Buchnera sp. (strain APS) [Buchnera sp. (in: enterobacteria)]ADP66473.1 flagellar FliJ protein [Buchnera aphidicola str. TLW03 (Acyrthosiphon pisum)]ADP67627.1 flagellar FliJ protein [Buchnera aphidicola str. JF98 (Acyrthosiphon pisum)]ACL29901.1 flagellar FliJ protein [Buchnera aphidicola str. Tu